MIFSAIVNRLPIYAVIIVQRPLISFVIYIFRNSNMLQNWRLLIEPRAVVR